MKLLIGAMAIKIVEDLEDDCGVGHSKDRKKRVKESGKEGKKRERGGITES